MGDPLERPNNRLERGGKAHKETLGWHSSETPFQKQQLSTWSLLSKSRLLPEESFAEPKGVSC